MNYYTSEEISEKVSIEEREFILSNSSYDLNVAGKEHLINYILITESKQFASTVKTFYSRYYWFCYFSEQYQSVNGSDAGLEQQLFQIIESLPEEVDWNIVKELEAQVKSKFV